MGKTGFAVRRVGIAAVELVEADSARTFCRHTHDQFGIGVIVRGAQRSASGRGQVEAAAGDLITVNPGEVHDGAPIGDSGRSWKMLYLDPQRVLEAVADINGEAGDPEFRYPVLADRSAAKTFVALYRTLAHGEDMDQLAPESLLYRLVAPLVVERPRPAAIPLSIRRARTLIDDAPADAVTLAELAREADVGKFQLLRGFAKFTGFTPHAYLMQRRTEMARQLIRQGVPLADAAAASGFADQSHMTRSFASRYGVTPGAYATAFA